MPSPLARVDRETAHRALVLAALAAKARAEAVAASFVPLPYQRPPDGDWRTWLLMGGRGSGKTAAGAAAMDAHANGEPCLTGKVPHRMAIVAPTSDDAVDTCIRGETGLITLNPAIDFSPGSRLKADLTWPNKSEASYFGCFGPEDVERFRGPQFCYEWYDEFAAWRKLDEAWQMLDFGLRLGPHPRRVITTTPKARQRLKLVIRDVRTVVVKAETDDNPHLSPERRAELYAEYGNTTIGRQELKAEILEDLPGALWLRSTIDETRRAVAPDLVRVLVAIDPAVTADEHSDETGMIVGGVDEQGEVFILDDLSGKYAPLGWARRAIGAYRDRGADCIVGEVNNGGDMVEATIRAVDNTASFKSVVASRGKRARAEPVAALYAKGKVHHVGAFPELEDQQCSWLPGDKSPDRMDALVWLVSELALSTGYGVLDYYRQQATQAEHVA